MTERLYSYNHQRAIAELEQLIADEIQEGTTAEELKPLRALLLTALLDNANNKTIQSLIEYAEEKRLHDNTIKALRTALHLRS